jgi:hypothetical protein
MRRLLVLLAVILISGGTAMAQGGLIGLYIDTWGDDCDIYDNGHGIIEVQVVHKFAPQAAAAQFSVITSPGFTGAYLGEELPASLLGGLFGNSQRGISIAYAECRSSPIHILTMKYYMFGTSARNSYIEVVADPTAKPPGIYMVDCAVPFPTLYTAVGGRAYINNDGTASCTTTPVRSTTWGGIKAMYAE